MNTRQLKYHGRKVNLKKSIKNPDFKSRTVLVENPWNYVDLWLKRHVKDKESPRIFWQQARDFARAAEMLPLNSAPLPAYYSMLNAAKALLDAYCVVYKDIHGVSGETSKGNRSLEKEIVKFKSSGVLAALCNHLNDMCHRTEYNLKELFYNLPYIHNAFCLTYTSIPELFIPLDNPRFIVENGTNKVWLIANLKGKWASKHTVKKLPNTFESIKKDENIIIIRKKDYVIWDYSNNEDSIKRFIDYHRSIRAEISYIYGPYRLWYLKRGGIKDAIKRSTMTLAYAAMHRLSELSRYDPLILARHFDCQHNWLISEFIRIAPRHFIDEIASEITGHDFMPPRIRDGT